MELALNLNLSKNGIKKDVVLKLLHIYKEKNVMQEPNFTSQHLEGRGEDVCIVSKK